MTTVTVNQTLTCALMNFVSPPQTLYDFCGSLDVERQVRSDFDVPSSILCGMPHRDELCWEGWSFVQIAQVYAEDWQMFFPPLPKSNAFSLPFFFFSLFLFLFVWEILYAGNWHSTVVSGFGSEERLHTYMMRRGLATGLIINVFQSWFKIWMCPHENFFFFSKLKKMWWIDWFFRCGRYHS